MFDEARWRVDGAMSTGKELYKLRTPVGVEKSLLSYVTLDLRCDVFRGWG